MALFVFSYCILSRYVAPVLALAGRFIMAVIMALKILINAMRVMIIAVMLLSMFVFFFFYLEVQFC